MEDIPCLHGLRIHPQSIPKSPPSILTPGQNFAIAPAIYFLFPETNGLTLEEVDHIFIKDDDGIGYSVDVSDTQSGEKRSVAGDAHASTVERAA